MPDRILRQSVLTSETLAGVSAEAERLFFRLTLIADDHGRFEADPRVILARCFPLMIEKLKVRQVAAWCGQLQQAAAVALYEVDGKIYGFFPSWSKHQRLRAERPSRYPDPATCGLLPPLAATCRQWRPESESDSDTESEVRMSDSTNQTSDAGASPDFDLMPEPQQPEKYPTAADARAVYECYLETFGFDESEREFSSWWRTKIRTRLKECEPDQGVKILCTVIRNFHDSPDWEFFREHGFIDLAKHILKSGTRVDEILHGRKGRK